MNDSPAVDELIGYAETPVTAASVCDGESRRLPDGCCFACGRPMDERGGPAACGYDGHADHHDGWGGVCARCDRDLWHPGDEDDDNDEDDEDDYALPVSRLLGEEVSA